MFFEMHPNSTLIATFTCNLLTTAERFTPSSLNQENVAIMSQSGRSCGI